MNDKKFNELVKMIRETKNRLNLLQDVYRKETGKRYNSFDFNYHRINGKRKEIL